MSPPRYIIIANSDSLRWKAYAPELTAFWSEQGVTPAVELVSWREVILRDGELDGLPAFDRPAIVRVESPGRDWDVAQLLLRAGSRVRGEDGEHWLTLPYRKGRLVSPGLFYAGFCSVLSRLRDGFLHRPHLRPCADPLELAEMFDKNATSARLEQAGIPVPPSLPALGTVEAASERTAPAAVRQRLCEAQQRIVGLRHRGGPADGRAAVGDQLDCPS